VKPELDTVTTAAYPAELRWSALWTGYAQSPLPADTAVGDPVFKVVVSFVGIRISADPEHPWVTRSTVHGLCEEFPHRNMAAVAVHKRHEINRSHTRWQKFTVVLFSGSLWLRREAQSSARCPVQTP